MKLIHLMAGTGISVPKDLEDLEISGIAYDSRKVEMNNVFICIKGFNTDGHTYVDDAIHAGAAVAIAQEPVASMRIPVLMAIDTRKTLSKISSNFFGCPTEGLRIFGVTGTNGKTTITYMLKSVIEAHGESCGLLGTISYQYGSKVYESVNTTPESYELQKMYAEMVADGIENCVMEVSSHSLSLSRADDILFDYAVFTNLTPDHMDFHRDLNDYFASKKRLFYLTGKASSINIDDSHGDLLFQELREKGLWACSYSLENKKADYFAETLTSSEKGSTIELFKGGEPIGSLAIRTPGTFSIYNAVATASICLEAGIDFGSVKAGLENLKGVPGRFELVENSRDMTVIVDYAHTPDALEKVLKTALGFKGGRLLCVFGCGGDRDTKKRPLMGKAAGTYADYCIITSDNPRTEDQTVITADIESGIYETGCIYEIIEDRYEAIKKAVSLYRKGDILIIAGKGHEDYQIIGTVKTHFDDREVARELIESQQQDK